MCVRAKTLETHTSMYFIFIFTIRLICEASMLHDAIAAASKAATAVGEYVFFFMCV